MELGHAPAVKVLGLFWLADSGQGLSGLCTPYSAFSDNLATLVDGEMLSVFALLIVYTAMVTVLRGAVGSELHGCAPYHESQHSWPTSSWQHNLLLRHSPCCLLCRAVAWRVWKRVCEMVRTIMILGLQKQMDHSKWAVTIPDTSDVVSASRKLLQNTTLTRISEDLSKVLSLHVREMLKR